MRRNLTSSLCVLGFALSGVATAQVPDNCVQTTYVSNNGGGEGWVVMFDLDATETMTISGVRTNFRNAAGESVTLEAFTSATSFGNETNPGAWTSAGTASGTSAGPDTPTQLTFFNPIDVPVGTSGLAFLYTVGEPDYTNGTGSNEVYTSADGALTLTANAAVTGQFTGSVIQTRVWNGDLCYDLGSAEKVTTLFDDNNFGSTGGAVYFDVEAQRPTTFDSIVVHSNATAGTPVGVEVYITDDSFAGNENNPARWRLAAVDDGSAVSNGENTPTPVQLASTFQIPPGTTGIAIVADGFGHEYTNGTGANQVHASADGNLRILAGSATNVPFSGSAFSPRVFNGALCASPTDNCVETLFASNNGGSDGGAVYFDVVAAQPVSISGLTGNFSNAGAFIDVEMWVRNGTAVGNETSPAGWNLVGLSDGLTIAAEEDDQTAVNFTSPVNLPAGRTGVALVVIGAGHEYTNGTGTNQVHESQDGILRIEAGSAGNVPFAAGIFSPRVWNGTLCYDRPFIGAEFCEAVPNSTGETGTISAVGSDDASDNNVRLIARNLPPGQFGIFVTSQGFVNIPMAGGSLGTLCIADPGIGRYQGPGQILNTGGNGVFSLAIDLTNHPTSTQFVNVTAGDNWNFQAWHRDFVGSPQSNFTNALRIRFQ